MLNNTNTTIICPLNDAESLTIITLAKRLGYDVRVSIQNSRFCTLDEEPDCTFQYLQPNVIVVEMPGIKKEAELSRQHKLFVIDHHDYISLGILRDHNKSSLEQCAALLECKLSKHERAIAANDRGYIYQMSKEGIPLQRMKEVRRMDLRFQGYTEEDFENAKEDVHNKQLTEKGVYIYHARGEEKYAALLDEHVYTMDCQHSNVVIIGTSTPQKGTYMFFSGDNNLVKELTTLGGFARFGAENYGFWGGFEFGPESVNLSTAMKILGAKS